MAACQGCNILDVVAFQGLNILNVRVMVAWNPHSQSSANNNNQDHVTSSQSLKQFLLIIDL
jgi:hypothetical protein